MLIIILKNGGYCDGLRIYAPDEIKKDSYIFVANKYHCQEIHQQLLTMGVPEKYILDIGQLIFDMAQKQYFDLQEMPHNLNESFADVGSLNGDTAKV